MRRICIVAAKRTPQGRLLGALAKSSAVDLALEAGKAALKHIDPDKIDQVIIGSVITAGQGMNIGRQICVRLELPIDRPACTVNAMCASGMQSVILAVQAIRAGAAQVVLCGGTESMSNAPYLLSRARSGYKLGDGLLIDALLHDGLTDPFTNEHMGLAVELVVDRYNITRQAQDEFALMSHQNWTKAQKQGKFNDELAKVDKLEFDEHPRPDTTFEKLALLKPVFKEDGTVTAGNASGINDGASILVVCDEAAAKKYDWKPLAMIRDGVAVGCEPELTPLGVVYATRKICTEQNLKIDDFDTIEINEAFAAQTLACVKELQIKPERLNPEGGAIALGHPIGNSGARLVTHLAHRINRGETRRGLATLCAGAGMGVAMVLESVEAEA